MPSQCSLTLFYELEKEENVKTLETLHYLNPSNKISLRVSLLPKKRSERDTPISEMLNKLGQLEEKLRALEEKLKGIEKESHLTLEDQLFFGLVFSLLLLVITFPSVTDMVSFFEGFELVKINPFLLTYAIKSMLVLTLFSSSGSRYYGAIKKSQPAKSLSLKSILLGIYGLVLEIVYLYGGTFLFQTIGEDMFPFLFLSFIITLIALYLGVIEKMILNFYQTIGQITLDKYMKVEASLWFLWFGICTVVLSLHLIAIRMFWTVPPSIITILSAYLISFLLPFYLIVRYRVKIDHIFEKICRRLRGS